MLSLLGVLSTFSLPTLPGPLWPRVVASDIVLSLDRKELFDVKSEFKQMTKVKLNF